MNTYRPRMRLLSMILLALAVIGLGGGLIRQRLVRVQLSRDIAEQQRTLFELRKDLRLLTAQSKDYYDLSLKLGGRLAECSWSEQMPFMVGQLTGIVESRGLLIETLRPEPMTTDDGILRFPMRVGTQSGIGDMTRILAEIDNAVPLLDIERLSVRASPGSSDKLQVDMTVASFVVLDKRAPITERRGVTTRTKSADASKGGPE